MKYYNAYLRLGRTLKFDEQPIRLLRPEGAPERIGEFVVRDWFVPGAMTDNLVMVRPIEGLFPEYFSWQVEEIPEHVAQEQTATLDLDCEICVSDVIGRFKDPLDAAISLFGVYSKMKLQPLGAAPSGVIRQEDLKIDGSANFFFVPQVIQSDASGNLKGWNQWRIGVPIDSNSPYVFRFGQQHYILRLVMLVWKTGGWVVSILPINSTALSLPAGSRLFYFSN